jgi:hypothetical protein
MQPKKEEITVGRGNSCNGEVHSPSIVRGVKSRWMRWAEHLSRMKKSTDRKTWKGKQHFGYLDVGVKLVLKRTGP